MAFGSERRPTPKAGLEEVSTVRGSGWVNGQHPIFLNDFEFHGSTHPLPRTVLTSSKHNVGTFEAKLLRTGRRKSRFSEDYIIDGDVGFCFVYLNQEGK